MELLFVFFLFMIAVAILGLCNGFRTAREERERKRRMERWRHRERMRALLRIIKGDKDS